MRSRRLSCTAWSWTPCTCWTHQNSSFLEHVLVDNILSKNLRPVVYHTNRNVNNICRTSGQHFVDEVQTCSRPLRRQRLSQSLALEPATFKFDSGKNCCFIHDSIIKMLRIVSVVHLLRGHPQSDGPQVNLELNLKTLRSWFHVYWLFLL